MKKTFQLFLSFAVFLLTISASIIAEKSIKEINIDNNGNKINENNIDNNIFLQKSQNHLTKNEIKIQTISKTNANLEKKTLIKNENKSKKNKIKNKSSKSNSFKRCGTCNGRGCSTCAGGLPYVRGRLGANGCYGPGYYGNGISGVYGGIYGNECGNGYYGNGYYGNGLYGNGFYGNGFYGNGYYGNGPGFHQGHAVGRGHIVGHSDLRGRYLNLRDAAYLLARERERKNCRANACNNKDKCYRANAGSRYLDRGHLAHKKLYDENNCKDRFCDAGKVFNKNNCDSAYNNKCNRNHNYLAQRSHQRLNTKCGKHEACCMNTNNLNKCCSDGNLMEEFDKLEHFKKCANGHKSNFNGKDCSVKKRHNVHSCKDRHSLACNKNGGHNLSKHNSHRDAKGNTCYKDWNRQNANAQFNKRGRECKAANKITNACKHDNKIAKEHKRANSNSCAVAHKDKCLKKLCDKNINNGCVDKRKCVNGAVSGAADRVSHAAPIC